MYSRNEILFICLILLVVYGFFKVGEKREHIEAHGPVNALQLNIQSKKVDIIRGDFILSLRKKRLVDGERFFIAANDPYGQRVNFERPADLFVQKFYVWPIKDERVIELLKGRSLKLEDLANVQAIAVEMNKLSRTGFGMTILPADEFMLDLAQNIRMDDIIKVSGVLYQQVKEVYGTPKKRQDFDKTTPEVLYVTHLKIINR